MTTLFTDEHIVDLWAVDRSKPGLPLTLYKTGRTKVISAKRRNEIARSLMSEARKINRGLQVRRLGLHLRGEREMSHASPLRLLEFVVMRVEVGVHLRLRDVRGPRHALPQIA